MENEFDVVKLFKGLTTAQARLLAGKIEGALPGLRAEVLSEIDPERVKEKNEMENEMENEEEGKRMTRLAERAIAEHAQAAAEKGVRKLEFDYTSRMAEIAQQPFAQRRDSIQHLKAEFKQRGLDPDSVVLSGNVIAGRPDLPIPEDDEPDEVEAIQARAIRIVTDENTATLETNYRREMAAVRCLDKRGRQDAVRKIQARYKSEGLDTDQVSF
jgi:hypothetical protein